MISRRLVRIKAMQTYYTFLQDSNSQNLDSLQRELEHSIEQSYSLFIHLHCQLINITDYAAERIEISKNKHFKSEADLNPNTKFIDNIIVNNLHTAVQIAKTLTDKTFSWSENSDFIKNLYLKITSSQYYIDYMNSNESSYKEDFEILKKIITKIILVEPLIDEIIEEHNIYWNDDLEFLSSNLIRNLKRHNAETIKSYKLPPIFKNQEDEDFAKKLIKTTALHSSNYDKLIQESLKKWELERIALIDRVLLHLALAEIMEFPNLPAKVSINEYIEISKFYSTDKSSLFINGVLDKIYLELKMSGKLNKSGLGLVE